MGDHRRIIAIAVAVAVGIAAGLGGGYARWGWPKDWYVFHDPAKLPATPQNDLIRLGLDIMVNTPAHIGPAASDPEKRFAGNALACSNCHLNGGLQAFAAPLVSTFATYPLMVNDAVESLAYRINGCLTRSLNGKPMPEDGEPMNALVAYIQYLGIGTREGVRVPGMGLMPLAEAAEIPDKTRGATVFADSCARCHGAAGQGEARTAGGGWAIPPLWGDGSFNAGAGMNDVRMAAAFIRANMPRGITYNEPELSVQQAWDVATFVTSQPRPPAPAADAGR